MSGPDEALPARIRVQLTFTGAVHERLIRVLAPLNRSQRKERLILLIYAGLGLEQRQDEPPQPEVRPSEIADDDDTAQAWAPQIDGDAAAALGLPL